MKLFIDGVALLLLTFSIAFSQNQIFPIWQPVGQPPNYLDNGERKASNITVVRQPYLTVFLPMKSDTNHPAVLVFPGGGYRQIVIEKEGYKSVELDFPTDISSTTNKDTILEPTNISLWYKIKTYIHNIKSKLLVGK